MMDPASNVVTRCFEPDSWEVSLYFKNGFQGNGMLTGAGCEQTLAQWGVINLQWLSSNGEQNPVDGSSRTDKNGVADTPKWNQSAYMLQWGTDAASLKEANTKADVTGRRLFLLYGLGKTVRKRWFERRSRQSQYRYSLRTHARRICADCRCCRVCRSRLTLRGGQR